MMKSERGWIVPGSGSGRKFSRLVAIPLVVLLFSVHAAGGSYAHEGAHDTDASATRTEISLGRLEFPTSAGAAAQAAFERGVLFLHSFEYAPARASFQDAQRLEVDFAMAYWGEAMTHHHTLWRHQDREAAIEGLERLGANPEERARKAPTQREKDYLAAVEILYGLTPETRPFDPIERYANYRSAMKQLHERYPDDLEARAFYGLSVLGVGFRNREYATYMKAAAVLTPVWEANREHPGGLHYLIHSYDDPVHAILGLPMARVYERVAPDAAHAQHMTSHIYVALGLWKDVANANVRALRVESAKAGEGPRSREAWHNRYWLHYARLQRGEWDEAREMLREAKSRLQDDPLPREPSYYGAMVARFLVDTEAWNEADAWRAPQGIEVPVPHYAFSLALAAAKRGRLDEARKHRNSMRVGGHGNAEILLAEAEVEILRLEIDAWIALAEGQGDRAIELATEAADRQTAMPFRYGPPRISKPSVELLGDLYAELGDDERAITAYREELTRSQLRTQSLLGLARAATRAGRSPDAADAYSALADAWRDADAGLPALSETRVGAGSRSRPIAE